MEMITRVWTMLDVRFERPGPMRGDHEPLVWLETEPITSVTGRFFNHKAQQQLSSLTGTIDPDLTVARLIRDHGVELVWTSDLAEHLSMRKKNGRWLLNVFDHKVWAFQHLMHPDLSPIPLDVLEELISTYNILFPMFDNDTEAFLRKECRIKSFYGLGFCGKKPSRKWIDYQYWREDLHQLSGVLNEPPRGLRQLWTTRRDDPNFLNLAIFWISGVIVAVLTIVASVCGVLSVQYAIEARNIALESNKIAARQLELETAQACVDETTRGRLGPKYCGP